MNIAKAALAVVLPVLLVACAGPSATDSGSRVDEVPMYGGMSRAAVPELRAGDDKFIADASRQFGGRDKAAAAWIDQGFALYRQDKLGLAMRRFNQAWLLDPKNPGAFHGFSAVLYDRGDNCGAMEMAERALQLELNTADFLADAALLLSLCAIDPKRPAGRDRMSLIKRSDDLFDKASSAKVNSAYVYDKWWQALYWRGNYRGAWEKVARMRAAGGVPHESYLRELRTKMAEPPQ
jgi:tetratricopeptide (TPR) repeat protein